MYPTCPNNTFIPGPVNESLIVSFRRAATQAEWDSQVEYDRQYREQAGEPPVEYGEFRPFPVNRFVRITPVSE